MGILDKVKNMFTEEVEESTPINKENSKMDLEEFEKDEDVKTNEEERVTSKKEERMMPIFFDDQDFATLDKPKEEKKSVTLEEKYYTKKVEPTEKKVFKLSPVISPVYGVLDKNYHKEDITPKRSTPKVTYYDKESITIDEVRKKAYGPTQEDVADTLLSQLEQQDELIGSRMQRRYHSNGMFDDLMDLDYNSKKMDKEELDTFSKTIEPISLDDFLVNNDEDLDDVNYKDPNEDTLTESDLFHLIDSMYEKEDE